MLTKNRKWYKIRGVRREKQRREFMRRTVAESLGAVHTHTHTHTLWSLENERGISFYALLKLYIRDG